VLALHALADHLERILDRAPEPRLEDDSPELRRRGLERLTGDGVDRLAEAITSAQARRQQQQRVAELVTEVVAAARLQEVEDRRHQQQWDDQADECAEPAIEQQ